MIKVFIENVLSIIKKIILSVLIIYAYNMIVYPTFSIIPMNLFTIMIIMIFGFPGVICLSLFSIFVL